MEQHELIYDTLLEIKQSIGEINGELKGVHNHLSISNGKLAKQETELTELKTINAYKKGMHTVIISAIGVGVTLITNFILKKF